MLLQLGINILSEAAVGVIDEGKTSAKWPFNASENKIEDQQLLEEKSGSRIICPNVRILNGILGLNCLAHYQLLDWVCLLPTSSNSQ